MILTYFSVINVAVLINAPINVNAQPIFNDTDISV